MLAAGGQAERLGGLGAKLENPVEEPLSVKELARTADSVNRLGVWVARILLVETADGLVKTR